MPTFEEAWAGLEEERQDLTAFVLGLDTSKQSAPSVPKAFSPAETLEHMAMVESIYLPLVQKFGPAKGTGKPNFLFGIVLRQMAKKKPIPTPPMFTPKVKELEARVAANRWETVRSELRDALGGIPLDQVCLKHPLFGKMCPQHIIELFSEHTKYHRARV